MGRLLKKKTEVEKRKKKDTRLTEQDEQQAKASQVQAKEEKKKQYIEAQKTGAAIKPDAASEPKENFIGKASIFLREVKIELGKVVWPTRKQTLLSTIVALVLVTIISVFLGMSDGILAWVISSLGRQS